MAAVSPASAAATHAAAPSLPMCARSRAGEAARNSAGRAGRGWESVAVMPDTGACGGPSPESLGFRPLGQKVSPARGDFLWRPRPKLAKLQPNPALERDLPRIVTPTICGSAENTGDSAALRRKAARHTQVRHPARRKTQCFRRWHGPCNIYPHDAVAPALDLQPRRRPHGETASAVADARTGALPSAWHGHCRGRGVRRGCERPAPAPRVVACACACWPVAPRAGPAVTRRATDSGPG